MQLAVATPQKYTAVYTAYFRVYSIYKKGEMRYTGLFYTPQYALLLSTTFSNNIEGMTDSRLQ